MALPPLKTKYPELVPLALLSNIQKGGAAYYRELAKNADPIVAAGAWCAMFDAKLVTRLFAAEVIPQCRYGAARTRAYAFFRAAHEHALARATAEVTAAGAAFPEQLAMRAEIAQDYAAEAAVAGELYLATGDIAHLQTASEKAEAAGGWRSALEWALRAVVLAPLNPVPLRRLFDVLESSAQADLMEEVGQIFQGRNLHVQTAQVFLAAASSMRGDAKLCLTRLKPLDDARLIATPALTMYLGTVRALRAQSEEKLGNFRRAYESYAALNAAERAPDVDPEFVYKGANIRARLAVPPLPAD